MRSLLLTVLFLALVGAGAYKQDENTRARTRRSKRGGGLFSGNTVHVHADEYFITYMYHYHRIVFNCVVCVLGKSGQIASPIIVKVDPVPQLQYFSMWFYAYQLCVLLCI